MTAAKDMPCLQLASRMLSEVEGPTLQKLQSIHRQLLGQLTQVISSPQTSSREAAVAVAGIGELAAPTHRFFGQQVPPSLASHCLVTTACSLQSPTYCTGLLALCGCRL